jgi:hypothetical protein
MSISAPTLVQAREALVSTHTRVLNLLSQVKEQGRKIVELEREVQKQATAASQAQQALASAKIEIEALRSQIPDDATVNAFNSLTQFLSAPAEEHPSLRFAA